MSYIEVPYSVFNECVERARKLAYHPEEIPPVAVPPRVFEDAVKSSNARAYHPSEGLEKSV
jgi:hypothetical protein